MGDSDEKPALITFRTNGLYWAAFAEFPDGTEEPADIYTTEQDMLEASCRTPAPYRIEYRPQELGCETGDELEAIPRLAAAYDLKQRARRG
jgi:hypothetical protein